MQLQEAKVFKYIFRFYDNLSIVSLGSLVICGVGGAAVWLGVAASGGIAAHTGDSWDQVYIGVAASGAIAAHAEVSWDQVYIRVAASVGIAAHTGDSWDGTRYM